MNIMKMNFSLLAVPTLIASLQTASAGDITGTVTLNGTPPPELVNTTIAENADCGKLHSEPVKTQFYVVGSGKELKDVVVYIKNLSGKSTGAGAPAVVLDQKGCEYTPYIFAVQTGQKIIVRNSDPVPMHNVHMIPKVDGNEERNVPQAAGSPDLTITFPKAEDFLKFQCDVHSWMFAYATVVDNPYFAVTGADGKFKLANVPPGKYTVQAMHRKAGVITKDVEVKDGGATVDFTLTVPAPK